MLPLGSVAEDAPPLNVVATLTTFADIARAVGGDRIEVRHIASPRFNPHFIQPRPTDVLKVKRADLFIHGGLDLEAWRGPLVDATANPHIRPGGDRELPLSTGIRLLDMPDSLTRAQGDIHMYGNPHYWLDPRNGLKVAETIAGKLESLDPDHASEYREGLQRFSDELSSAMEKWKSLLAPFAGRELVAYHDEWVYLFDFAGIHAEIFLEPKPGIPPTPKSLLKAERHIRENDIPAIVQATFMSPRPAKRISKRTGIPVIHLCQNVDELPAATSYTSLITYNITQILSAFQD